MHLPAHRDRADVDAGGGREAPAVDLDALAPVVGKDPEVERLVRALADTAQASGERDVGTRQLDADQLVDRATSRA
jgi:hypothetical protein